jgi:hypothetical protein
METRKNQGMNRHIMIGRYTNHKTLDTSYDQQTTDLGAFQQDDCFGNVNEQGLVVEYVVLLVGY